LDGSSPPHDRPLMAVAPPRWYAESGAFGELTVADTHWRAVHDYDQKVSETLRGLFRHLLGIFHWTGYRSSPPQWK